MQQGFEHVRDVGHLDTWLLHKSWSTHGGFLFLLLCRLGIVFMGGQLPCKSHTSCHNCLEGGDCVQFSGHSWSCTSCIWSETLTSCYGMQGNKSPMGTPNQAWLALDLLSTLSFLYEAGHGAAVRQILELPLAQCPEVLVLSFASARR